MKNTTKSLVLLLIFTMINSFGQQEKGIVGFNNWLNNWTEFKPAKSEYGDPNQILAGQISSDMTLLKRNVYMLQGDVYVTNNAILTIEPGTIIMGDFDSRGALIITKGAKIMAQGLETDPIVFTSVRPLKKAGDWGGLIILGDAPLNRFGDYTSLKLELNSSLTSYGGKNASNSAGILKHVRVEYAGKKLESGERFDALFLGGIGSGTVIDNVMVSYSGSNSFVMNGGEVSLSKLVSYRSSGVDFKFNFGANAKLDNSLAVRSPYLTSGTKSSSCIEVSSYDKKEEFDSQKKESVVLANNITMVNDSENLDEDVKSGLVKEGVFVDANASLILRKSVISGFSPAIILNNQIEINDLNLSKLRFEEMYFNLCNGNIFLEDVDNNEDLESWYGNSAFFNVYGKTNNIDTFVDYANSKRPDFRLQLSNIKAISKN